MVSTPITDALEQIGAKDVHQSWPEAISQFCKAVAVARQFETELAGLRLLAAEPHYIERVKEVMGPLSLWSKSGLDAEIAARVALARPEDAQAKRFAAAFLHACDYEGTYFGLEYTYWDAAKLLGRDSRVPQQHTDAPHNGKA